MGKRKQYTPDEITTAKQIIINGIVNGKSLSRILKKHKGTIPQRNLVYQWLNDTHEKFDASFKNNYIHARKESAENDVDKIEMIVDDVRKNKLKPDQARVMVDALKWIAGKKKPKKYGNHVDITSDGEALGSQLAIFQLPDNGRGIPSNNETK